MATKEQQKIALVALMQELIRNDVDIIKICHNLAYQMQGPGGDHDTTQAHEFLLNVLDNEIGEEKYSVQKNKISITPVDIEEF